MADQRKPGSPATPSLTSTRQLLDELDVLMQRMLALPVGDSAAETTSGTGPATSLLDSPPELAARECRLEDSKRPSEPQKPRSYSYEQSPAEEPEAADIIEKADAAQEAGTAPAETPQRDEESAPETNDTNEVESQGPEAEPEQAEANPFTFLPGKISTVSAETLTALTGPTTALKDEPVVQRSRLLAAAARRQRWWLWPLKFANGAFDVFTHLLGPLGSWLRQPSGRNFLGWLGLVLLLAAIALQVVMWVTG
jgi:hypothetical protein